RASTASACATTAILVSDSVQDLTECRLLVVGVEVLQSVPVGATLMVEVRRGLGRGAGWLRWTGCGIPTLCDGDGLGLADLAESTCGGAPLGGRGDALARGDGHVPLRDRGAAA